MDNINEIIKTLHDEGVISTEQVTIIALVNNGFSIGEAKYIATHLNTEDKSRKRKNTRWTPEEKATLQSLYEQGVSRDEIAKYLKRSKQQVGGMIGAMRLLRPKKDAV